MLPSLPTLIDSNWIRTAGWTVRLALLFVWLRRLLRRPRLRCDRALAASRHRVRPAAEHGPTL
jgi:hypothetical protein